MAQNIQVPEKSGGDQSQTRRLLAIWRLRTPGLLLVLFLAVAAKLAGQMVPVVPEAVLALVAGILVNNLVMSSLDSHRAGIRFAQKSILQVAIVLLGGSLSFTTVLKIGSNALVVILLSFVFSFSLSLLFARVFSLPGRVGALLGSGTAICGASAIITIGPLVAASEAEIAYAMATIFSFNMLAVLIYPAIGNILNLSNLGFGIWAGTSVNDTSAVIATSYIFSAGAGAIATVVKLTRTLLLIPLAVGIGCVASARGNQRHASVLKAIPWFVLGFAGMATINSIGLLPGDLPRVLTGVAQFLIVVVLAAVGLSVDIARMRAMGAKPFVVGILLAGVMSILSLVTIFILGMA